MSRYEQLDFATFKKGFDGGGGWQPVWVARGEHDDDDYADPDDPDASPEDMCPEGEPNTVVMDMICYHRLTDGKVKFLEVEYNSQEELDWLRAWIAREMEAMFEDIRGTLASHVPEAF